MRCLRLPQVFCGCWEWGFASLSSVYALAGWWGAKKSLAVARDFELDGALGLLDGPFLNRNFHFNSFVWHVASISWLRHDFVSYFQTGYNFTEC